MDWIVLALWIAATVTIALIVEDWWLRRRRRDEHPALSEIPDCFAMQLEPGDEDKLACDECRFRRPCRAIKAPR